jgi:hypothetical protein
MLVLLTKIRDCLGEIIALAIGTKLRKHTPRSIEFRPALVAHVSIGIRIPCGIPLAASSKTQAEANQGKRDYNRPEIKTINF